MHRFTGSKQHTVASVCYSVLAMSMPLATPNGGLHLGFFLLPLVAFMLHGCIDLSGLKEIVDTVLNAAQQLQPCPEWVGTNTTPICSTDGLVSIGACYNNTDAMAKVTCIAKMAGTAELNITGYLNYECPDEGSEAKCVFNSSYDHFFNQLNASAQVEQKFEAAPMVFGGVNSKLTGLGFMVGLVSLTGGAAFLVLRRVKISPANSVQTEWLSEEHGDTL